MRQTFISGLCLILSLCLHNSLQAQSWENLPSTKKARSETSAITYQGQIYVFNGFAPNIKIENSIEKFNPANQQWSVIGGTSTLHGTAVTHNGLVLVGQEVWLIGGRLGNHPGKVSAKVWIYNIGRKQWRQGPSMPVPVAGGGAAVVNNRIHWFGGLDANARCDVGSHYTLDLAKQAAGWKNISAQAAMPVPRNHFGTTVLNGRIFAIGGQFGHDGCPGKPSKDTNLVHAFNPNNNQWSQMANLPTVQSHIEPSTFTHNGHIYVVGGETNGNKVWRYTASNNRWETIAVLPQRLLAPVARIFNGSLYVAGGGAPNTVVPTTQVIRLNLDSNSETQPPVPSPSPTQPSTVEAPVVEVPVAVTPFTGTAIILAMEAENFDRITNTNSHQWISGPTAGAVSKQSMISSPDSGGRTETGGPSLSYLLNFTETGDYYVWIRGLGDAGSAGQSNSLHASLDDQAIGDAGNIDGFPSNWTWSNSKRDGSRATITITTKGVHSLNLWMREDGLAVDRFALSNDPGYKPSDLGPAGFDGTVDDGTTTIVNPATDSGDSISVSGNRISWPSNGWYQVLETMNYSAVCNGGDSCDVNAGVYLVINHSSGERFDNIRVEKPAGQTVTNNAANNGFYIDVNSIIALDDNWIEVQQSNGLNSLCQGNSTCAVANGNYIIINHSQNKRFEKISVPDLEGLYTKPLFLSQGETETTTPETTLSEITLSEITVNGQRISWPAGDYYQVQSSQTYTTLCEGGNYCDVEPGSYTVINLSTGTRITGVIVDY